MIHKLNNYYALAISTDEYCRFRFREYRSTNKEIDVLRSQNIIPVELSEVFHLDFKVSVCRVYIDRWQKAILQQP